MNKCQRSSITDRKAHWSLIKQAIPVNTARSSPRARSSCESSLHPHSEVRTLRTQSFQFTHCREEPCPGIQTISRQVLWPAGFITPAIILKVSVFTNRTLISLITRHDIKRCCASLKSSSLSFATVEGFCSTQFTCNARLEVKSKMNVFFSPRLNQTITRV